MLAGWAAAIVAAGTQANTAAIMLPDIGPDISPDNSFAIALFLIACMTRSGRAGGACHLGNPNARFKPQLQAAQVTVR